MSWQGESNLRSRFCDCWVDVCSERKVCKGERIITSVLEIRSGYVPKAQQAAQQGPLALWHSTCGRSPQLASKQSTQVSPRAYTDMLRSPKELSTRRFSATAAMVFGVYIDVVLSLEDRCCAKMRSQAFYDRTTGRIRKRSCSEIGGVFWLLLKPQLPTSDQYFRVLCV